MNIELSIQFNRWSFGDELIGGIHVDCCVFPYCSKELTEFIRDVVGVTYGAVFNLKGKW